MLKLNKRKVPGNGTWQGNLNIALQDGTRCWAYTADTSGARRSIGRQGQPLTSARYSGKCIRWRSGSSTGLNTASPGQMSISAW